MATTRPYGVGPYGVGPYSRITGLIELGGFAVVAFNTQGKMIRTWQQPSHICEVGAWTLTTLPTGPPNELETVA